MCDEGIGERLGWEGLVGGEGGLEGLTSLITVTSDEGLVKGGLECGHLIRGERKGLWGRSWKLLGLFATGVRLVPVESKH